jgi:hypothetical protein
VVGGSEWLQVWRAGVAPGSLRVCDQSVDSFDFRNFLQTDGPSVPVKSLPNAKSPTVALSDTIATFEAPNQAQSHSPDLKFPTSSTGSHSPAMISTPSPPHCLVFPQATPGATHPARDLHKQHPEPLACSPGWGRNRGPEAESPSRQPKAGPGSG